MLPDPSLGGPSEGNPHNPSPAKLAGGCRRGKYAHGAISKPLTHDSDVTDVPRWTRKSAPPPTRTRPVEFGMLGGMIAVRCPHDLDPIMPRAGLVGAGQPSMAHRALADRARGRRRSSPGSAAGPSGCHAASLERRDLLARCSDQRYRPQIPARIWFLWSLRHRRSSMISRPASPEASIDRYLLVRSPSRHSPVRPTPTRCACTTGW